MKYSDDDKKRREQRRLKTRFELHRIHIWLERLTLNSEKRKRAIEAYEFYDDDPDDFLRDKHDTSLPNNIYLTPKTMFTSDIINSADLQGVRQGLKNLIKKQHTNKYFFAPARDEGTFDELKNHEKGADFWSNLGVIDFGNNEELSSIVESAEVSVSNLNDTNFIILLQIDFTKEERNKLSNIISGNFYEQHITYYKNISGKPWKKPKGVTEAEQEKLRRTRKPGSSTFVGKGFSGDTFDKTVVLDREYDHIKKEVFSEIGNFVPLELMKRDIIQPAYVVYETNSNGFSDVSGDFLRSMNMPDGFKQSIREYFEKKENTEICYDHSSLNDESNHYLVYIKDRCEPGPDSGYTSAESYFCNTFDYIYKSIVRYDYASALYDEYRDTIFVYRNRMSLLKLSSWSYRKALKYRNTYVRDLNFYKSAMTVYKPWDKIKDEMNSVKWMNDYEITGLYENASHVATDRLIEFDESARKEADDNINICKDLSDRTNALRNNIMTLISIALAFASLVIAYLTMVQKP